MVRLGGGLFFLLLIGVWVITIASVIRTPDGGYRAGNQIVWWLLVIRRPIIGVPLYWVIGAPTTR